jgi:hypothetical protein
LNPPFLLGDGSNLPLIELAISSCVETASAESAAMLRAGVDGVNSFARLHREALSTIPNAIFRQEFFDSRAKIKFRFFLVGFKRGF